MIEDQIQVFTRAKRLKETFTSSMYLRQKKRNNFVVSWKNGTNYGIIKYFFQINGVIYAAINELIKEPRLRTETPIHRQFKMYVFEIAVSIRKSYSLKFVNIEDLKKIFLINNYICILPNDYEPK